MLSMQLVDVRVPAGLLASDVNGSDPMDVGSAERRANMATRRELAKHPDSFGLLAYMWALANARAAWLDRDVSTTPIMRVGWAFNNLVFMRWWLDHIEVTNADHNCFISMQTHAAHVIDDQMMAVLVLLWGSRFPTKA